MKPIKEILRSLTKKDDRLKKELEEAAARIIRTAEAARKAGQEKETGKAQPVPKK